jgi:hypothetical protein
MTTITIETWLNSGANNHSSYREEFEIEADQWAAMSEDEKDDYAREVAFGRSDWGWKVKEED